jgi:hypothetical protein
VAQVAKPMSDTVKQPCRYFFASVQWCGCKRNQKTGNQNTEHMKKSAQLASNPAPGHLVNIEGLSKIKGPSVRQLRTMLEKGILSSYRFGYRSLMFDPAQFDKDIAAFKVKSVADRNGGGGK